MPLFFLAGVNFMRYGWRAKQNLHKVFLFMVWWKLLQRNEMKWIPWLLIHPCAVTKSFETECEWPFETRYSMHNSDLSCWFQWNKQHIIQHLRQRFVWFFFFYFLNEHNCWKKIIVSLSWNFMRIEHELMNQAIHTLDKKRSNREINK